MENLKNLDWNETLLKIHAYASSELAKNLILKTQPFSESQKARAQVLEIMDATRIVSLDFRPSIEGLDSYSTWSERLKKKSTLHGPEFQDIRRFCYDILNVQKALNSHSNDWTQNTSQKLMDPTPILESIDRVFTFEGEIRSDASEELKKLFSEKKSLEKQLRTTLERFVRAHELDNILQDKFVTNREGRWVLPIKSGKQHQFEGIIHDSSQSKQTVFMEPKEVILINNRLKQVEGEIEKEIERILTQLTHFVSQFSDPIQIAYDVLLEVDVRLAQAQFTLKIKGAPFEFHPNSFHLIDIRHPLLSFQSQKEVVSNTVQFDEGKQILILTGPNAGGKTVLLKAVGLAAQMARCGLPLSASSETRLPFFKNLIIGIGDTQNIDEHMSTFAAHLKTLTQALEAQGPQTLILVDEICGSTDPEEGAALARSFIEHYAENKVFGVITSHLGPLKKVWPEDSPILCGSMEFLDHPTYRLFLGIHGRSFALKTAKSAGVPQSIIQKAMGFLSKESRVREENMDEIEAYKEQVARTADKLKAESRSMEAQKKKYQGLIEKFEKEKQSYLQKVIERAEKRIEKIIEEFRAQPNISKVRAEFPKIIKSVGTSPEILTIEEFKKQLPPGSSAYISTLGQDGIIQGAPNSKGEVPILSRSMRLHVHWKDLRKSQQSESPSYIPHKTSKQSLPQEELEIDLRGLTSDEAIDKLEKFLDKALQSQADQVRIIHGHGTEALKKSIRGYLSRSVYIQKWKAGSASSKDDGSTLAVLS